MTARWLWLGVLCVAAIYVTICVLHPELAFARWGGGDGR